MIKDFDVIEYNFKKDITIVPISDVHIGHKSFMEKEFKEVIAQIKNNPNIYTVIVGDVIDNGIAHGKVANAVYDNNMTPLQQIEKAVELLSPIKDKILGVVSGNHCARTEKLTTLNPLQCVCYELGIDKVYRNNLCIIKIKLGERNESTRQTYTMLIHHGVGNENSSLKKDKDFINSFEGADIICTGHTHQGKCSQHIKKVIDNHNSKVYDKVISVIVCNSFLGEADYALKSMMVGSPHSTISFDLTKGNKKKTIIHIN